MIRTVSLTLLAATTLYSPPRLVAQQVVTIGNWREVRTIRLGGLQTRMEVSPYRTLRLVSEADKGVLVSENLAPDSLRGWHDRILSEFDKHARAKYVFGNSILIEQARVNDVMGYALTVADTNGVARSVIMDTGALAEFLDLVLTGVMAATRLADTDLQRTGPLVETPVSLAKPVSSVYPRNARLAGVSGKALVQFVVDTLGRARPETINCLEATYKDFADAAIGTVKTMVFNPATLEGHKIERLVQYPFDYKLNAVLPITPFPVPTRGRR